MHKVQLEVLPSNVRLLCIKVYQTEVARLDPNKDFSLRSFENNLRVLVKPNGEVKTKAVVSMYMKEFGLI